MKHRILSLLLVMFAAMVYAQPNLTTGSNTTICQGASTAISVLATGGTAPYNYLWSNASTLSNAATANPIAAPLATTTYTVTVTDAASATATASVTVTVNPTPSVAISPAIPAQGICNGSVVQLYSTIAPLPCGPGVSAPGSALTSIGSGTASQAGGLLQPPYMLSNATNSYKQQMLYTNTELLAAMDRGRVISRLGFNLSQFNSNAILQNVVVKIGCTSQDSLTTWENDLTTVYTSATYTPINGWNMFILQVPYFWSGTGNLVVEICTYNANTSGNFSNKAQCTATPNASYLYQASTSDLCSSPGVATKGYDRPNMRINYNDMAVPITYTYNWTATNGSTVSNPTAAYALGTVNDTSNYVLQVTNNLGCSGSDTILIEPRGFSALVIDSIHRENALCGLSDGSLGIYVTGCAPFTYQWNNGASTQNITQLSEGNYVAIVSDCNGCRSMARDSITVFNNLVVSSIVSSANCSDSADGSICVNIISGNGGYTYVWSNGSGLNTSCLTNLAAGTYGVTVTDVNACTAYTSGNVLQASAVTAAITNITNASSCSTFDGSVCVAPSGGTAPYQYLWSNARNTACISGLNVGWYTVTVIDPNGCSATSAVNINADNNAVDITLDSIVDVKCNGEATGAIYITPTGGTAPYTYLWNTGAIVDDHLNLSAGSYFVLVTDANGCAIQDTFTVGETDSLLISNSVINVSCFGGNDGSLSATVSGGTPPYTYLWSNASTANPLLTLPAQVYYVTATDINGCSASAGETILQPTQLSVGITNAGSDTLLPDTLNTIVIGGIPPYSYAWSTGLSGNFPSQVIGVEGIYRVTVVDANGCTATDSYTFLLCPDTCVWPGDADYSGTADNNDLLAIGLAYGATGSTRTDQSIAWYAHPSTNWATYLGDTTNYKHIDCNGDGVVDSDDTLAILQNYTLTHPRSGPDEVRGGIPSLRIRMVPDTLEDGETLIAHLELGDANSTAMNVYGLAFTFNFDALVVDTNEVYIAFDNNSWLCNSATDHIDIDKKDVSAGQIHTALTRIDHTTRSGGGEIGKVSMKITTGNINGKDLANYVMNSYITNLRVIDNLGNVLDVDAIGDEANVQYEPTGINEVNWKGEVSLYPNPAREQLIVTSTQTPINSLQVQNLIGETVWVQQNLATTKVAVNTATLAEGVYVLQLGAGNRVYHAKFIVVK